MSAGTFAQWTPSVEAVGWLHPRNWGHHLPTRDECAKIVRALAGHRWDHMYLAPMAGTLLLHPELFLAGACRPFASTEVIRGAAAAFGVVLDSGLHRPGSVFFRTAPRTELHWGLEGGELVETPTGPAVALDSGYRGDDGWAWLFLSPGGGIPVEVKGVPTQLVDRSSGIDLDAHRAAFEVLLSDGGPGWDPTAPERFVAATGWPLPAAKILLAGMPDLDSCYHNWMPKQIREFLGLKVAEAATAREFLRDLDDGLLVKLVQAGVSDPMRTVRDGLDIDAMIQCWSSNVDNTIMLPEDILVEADRSLPYGGRRAINRLTRDGTSLDELRSWLWLASNLPLNNQLRPWLADQLDTMTATSGRATYSQDVWTTSGNRNKLRTVFGLPGFDQVPASTVAHIGPWRITHCDNHDEVVFKPFDVTDWTVELERANALDGVLSLDPGAAFLAPTVLGQLAPIQEWLRTPGHGWPQDPLASAPEILTDVQTTLDLPEDSARYWLQLLTLHNPTDKNIHHWNNWTRTRRTKAATPLIEKGLVIEAKRPRAGRTLFLPGDWMQARSPHLPLETWKAPLYHLENTPKVKPPFEIVLPLIPLPQLFSDAWRRYRDGDLPGHEELRTERYRR